MGLPDPIEFSLERGIVNEETLLLARSKLGEVYDKILYVLENYMDMPKDQMKLIALWIIGTYFHGSFSTYPFLFINAMRGSGKTRLLRIISYLSKGSRGQVQTGITESVLFRMPPGDTLVLDELENIGNKERGTLREYMNACYKKGGVVQRMKKAKFQGQEEWIKDTFSPYKPIAMANIWGMDEVLGDRCISLVLEKSSNPRKTKKVEDFDTNPIFLDIKRTLDIISVVCVVSLRPGRYITAWNDYVDAKYNSITTYYTLTTQTTLTTQEEMENDILEKEERIEMFNRIDELGIDGRNFELLFPMILVSKLLGDDILAETLSFGKTMMDHKKEDEFAESRDVCLYEFISKKEQTLEYHHLSKLTTDFKTFLGSDDDWINEKWVGRALKRLNLLIDKKRQASGRIVQLNVIKAKEKLKIFKSDDT